MTRSYLSLAATLLAAISVTGCGTYTSTSQPNWSLTESSPQPSAQQAGEPAEMPLPTYGSEGSLGPPSY